MARAGRALPPAGRGAGTGMKLSETGIFIAMGLSQFSATYWYFAIYKHSPGVALNEYIGGIKSGNVEKQYAMLDAADKQALPTEKDYEKKCQQARGYTERIIGVTNLINRFPTPKTPTHSTPRRSVSMPRSLCAAWRERT